MDLFVIPESFIPNSEIEADVEDTEEVVSNETETYKNDSSSDNSDIEDGSKYEEESCNSDTDEEEPITENQTDVSAEKEPISENQTDVSAEKELISENQTDVSAEKEPISENQTDVEKEIEVDLEEEKSNTDIDNSKIEIQNLLDTKTIKELRELCKSKGLLTNGKKLDLATRYISSQTDNETDIIIC